ncbi:class I SAM-dependent methyltransferase [Streptomyces sp. NPDC051907]|uniref:class I SAM-dependent DNA methyltransferase n=1 Tax=Streptomyces sp. NPDC051907 TaxID=3155284 RepID=UPI003437A4FE
MTEPDFLQTTRASYDTVADDYAEHARDMLATRPLDRGMLDAFAESVLADGGGPVVDIGCGPGQVAAHLAGRGLSVSGIDLSPQMIAAARRDYPGLRFEVGSMTDLDLPDGGLAGALAWYSTIHLPTELLPGVFAEFHRVLAPGGRLLLGFQVGDEPRHRTEAYGKALSLVFHRRRPERVAELLAEAGLALQAQLVREAHDDGVEKTPQAFLLAVKGGKP